MQLHDLVASLVDASTLQTLPNVSVRDVTVSSKRVRPASLFIALTGAETDGHHFVEEAIARGAVAIVGDRTESVWWHRVQGQHPRIPCIRVLDARAALVQLGQRFYDYPMTHLQLVGVTGTNGKTTTSFLVDHLLRARGATVGLIGTVAYRCGDRQLPSTNTTPGQLELQALFAQMVQRRIPWCVMEVSSHALAQRRVEGLTFARAILTNVGSDHLDYHRTQEAYFAAKCRLFEQLEPGGRAVVNGDDPFGQRLMASLRAQNGRGPQLVTFGLTPAADFWASAWEYRWTGTSFHLHTPTATFPVTTRLLGCHNILNVLAAVGCLWDHGWSCAQWQQMLAQFPGVPGRLELIPAGHDIRRGAGRPGGQDLRVVVDYAHTATALEAAMLTVRSLQPRRVLVVFGCGGNRDRSKRPAMGRVAGRLADFVCLTSDNPRTEDPAAIAREVELGVRETTTPYTSILDRGEAIAHTLAQAQPGDCVLIAGKGHETTQVLHDTVIPFDDRQVVRQWLVSESAWEAGLTPSPACQPKAGDSTSAQQSRPTFGGPRQVVG